MSRESHTTRAHSRYSRIPRSDTVIASNSRDAESIRAICNDRFSQQFNPYPSFPMQKLLVKDKTRVRRSVINQLSIPRYVAKQNFRSIGIDS